MPPSTAQAPERLLPPPSELRPALAEALRRVRILRGLLKLSEQAEAMRPCGNQSRQEGAHHDAR